MMNTGATIAAYDSREKAFEKKFEHDETMRFRIAAHAAKALGQWAADRMGLMGAESDSYVMDALDADLSQKGHVKLIEKIESDFLARGIPQSHELVRQELDRFVTEARAVIETGEG